MAKDLLQEIGVGFGQKLRDWLYDWSENLPTQIVREESSDTPYLERYFLFDAFGFIGYLHRLVSSTPAGRVHDDNGVFAISIVLNGYYLELRKDGAHLRKYISVLRSDTTPNFLLPDEVPSVWTLFIHRKVREEDTDFLEKVATKEYHPPPWWRIAPIGHFAKGRKPRD